ncbi:MAG: hypothetical protein JNN28_11250 [Saprospiraceae bacterium]|nr:hypothetical protein [Saprospiraceae bacterium]
MLLLSHALMAQNKVLVTVNISPPYSHRFADYTQYQTQAFLTFTNTTQQDLQMKVLCEITGQGTGFYLKTRPDYVPNQVITLAPGETRQYNGNSLTGYLDRNNTEDNIPDDLEVEILRTGLLPQDVYDYCIEVVDINTQEVLGRRCTVIPIQYLSPPQPNIPWCGETHDILSNPNINFSWVPATGGGLGNANLRYDFYLVPVPAGQDPGQLLELAMDGQLPGQFFNWPDIPSPNFIYNAIQYGPLAQGQYVWGIVAHDLNGLVGIENNGRSQFCTLTLGKLDVDPEGVADVVDGSDYLSNCSCQAPSQAPGGLAANELLQVGTDIKVGAYDMRILTNTGNGNGTGKISLPGFPGGVSLPILVDFTNVSINSDRKMISGNVKAQLKEEAGFLPKLADPDISTLPLGTDQINQLDQYFVNNKDHLLSSIGNALESSGFQLPLGLDKEIGGQQVVVAITGLYLDATRAALDAAVVLNLLDAGTKIALSGRTICLKDGLGLCGEADLYLAEDLEIPSLNMAIRGLKQAGNPEKSTRVKFDKEGFKRLYIKALYRFPTQTLTKAQGAGQVEASLSGETETGWTDWMATVEMDPFQITGVNDFTFHPGTSFYDHSSKKNPDNMPSDYPEGQSPTWTGFFLKTIQVDLPPIFKNKNNNQPLSGSATNVIIDGDGLTGALNLNNILAIGDGGNGSWQFSVDRFTVKFLKNTFQNGGFEGRLLLPITNRGVQSQLNYSSLLSYANSQFTYQFVVTPKEDLEVDLFAAIFSLNNNSNISISYQAGSGFEASAMLHGNFSIGGKFVNDLPRIQLAHISFQDFKLKTNYPYIEEGAKFNAALGSPPHSVAGLPISLTGWKFANNGIGLQANMEIRLSSYVGFLPNAASAFTVYGTFNNGTPVFDHFEVEKIKLDADFSALKVKGELAFFHKDANWGEGFGGSVAAVFPPGFSVASRMQVGDKNGTGYWYVDGQTAVGSNFVAGLNAFGFSGGAYYNLTPTGFNLQNDITVSNDPNDSSFPGGAPSGIQYQVTNGSSGMKASLVIGLGTKELFNANGALNVTYKDGGIEILHILGKARMFGSPGSSGLANGEIDVRYDFPQKIFDLATSLSLTLPVFSGTGFLSLHANGTTGDWNFKLGRPLGWTPGSPCVIKVDLGPLDVEAGAYFQCGNYNVDGLPTRLPQMMQELFPEYPKGYSRVSFGDGLANGKAIALGAYFLANFHQNYLVFYGELSAAFGFDLQLAQTSQTCGIYSPVGMNGWYGQGQFYAGVKAAIGIEVDLFFISGKFEILSVSVGALLRGGGPNPTWVTGRVGGRFSILGGLVEGTCSFEFTLGDQCIIEKDPLASLKIINELTPKPNSGDQVSELQEVDVDPAATVNLKMGKEFFLEEIKNVNGTPVTIPRLFKFEESNLQATFKQVNGPEIPIEKEYDPEGFGLLLWRREMLLPNTDYIVTFTANVLECSKVAKEALSEDGQSGQLLYFGTCDGVWNAAVIKKPGQAEQTFKEVKTIRFRTNKGLLRLKPEKVIYSLPHHGQRYFCYQDIAAQAILALSEKTTIDNILGNPNDEGAAKSLKVRLIPHGANAEALDGFPVDQVSYSTIDPQLLDDYSQDIQSSKAEHYWSSFKFRALQPNTTYGVQFYVEWETPPSSAPNNALATTIRKRSIANGQADINERELNLSKYRLRRNQREVYRYYFRTSSYSAIQNKLADLECNQLNFKEFEGEKGIGTPLSIRPPTSKDWNAVAQKLKSFYPADILQPGSGSGYNDKPKGIFLQKAGFTGNEKFDLFDAYGFEKTIRNRTYRIRPLIELDMGAMKDYWDHFFQSAMDTLKRNGIREVKFRAPGERHSGWVMTDPKLKIFGVMDSLGGNAALGNTNSNMSAIHGNFNSGIKMVKNSNNNIYQQTIYDPNLLEITRDLISMAGYYPGAMPPGIAWLNDVIHGGIISDIPGQFLQNQFLSNIGASFDFVNKQSPQVFNPTQGIKGAGSIRVNVVPNVDNQKGFQIGKQ